MFVKVPWLDHIDTLERNYGVAVSDVDNDGNMDWIVAGFSGSNFVFTYDKELGRLENIALRNTAYQELMDPEGNAIGVCACDIDGDGREEIYFLNTNNAYAGRSSYGDKLFKWRNGKYVDLYSDSVNLKLTAKGFAGRSVACIDRFGSGKYSIAIATYSQGGMGNFALIEMNEMHPENHVEEGRIVLHNVAAEAGIERATGGRGLIVGPIFGNDGKSDIFFGNEGNYRLGNRGENYLFQNQGDGTFKDVASDSDILDENENGRGLAIGDFNQDGLIDIVCGNWEGHHRIFLQYKTKDGKQKFRNVATSDFSDPSMIRTVISADFDNDGFPEIFLNNICDHYKSQPNKLFTIKPKSDNPTIVQIPIGAALESNGYGTGAAVADIDQDGSLELLVSHGESQAQPINVYKVNGDKLTSNNWLRVHPKTKYGAPARGALITAITSSGDRLMQVIDGGSGYLCQMEPFAHFGAGLDFIVEIKVIWPDGKSEVRTLSSSDRNSVVVVNHPDTDVIKAMRTRGDSYKESQNINITLSKSHEEL